MLLKNWKVVLGGVAMLVVVLWGTAQKVRADGLDDDINHPKTGYIVKLTNCRGALQDQSDAIDRMGEKTKDLEAQLAHADGEAKIIMKAQDKRIETLLAEAKANDCKGNVARFYKQLKGNTWHGE